MIRFLSLLVILLLTNFSFSQITVFQDDLEGTSTWISAGDLIPNQWLQDVCAGNGPTIAAGTKAMYITSNGGALGCVGSLPNNYNYVNSATGISKAIIYHTVPASCAGNLQFQFDSKLDVDGVNHKADAIYSTDGGTTWTILAAIPSNATAWSVNNIALPTSLGGSSFLIGFQFTYDDVSTIGNLPLAFDNVKVTGTAVSDVTPPIVVCPPNQVVYVNSLCQATTPSFIALATATDNCSATNNLVFTQSPAVGALISTNTSVQITVTDEIGNQGFCSFTALATDTIKPIVICETEVVLPINASCEMIVPNVITLATTTDNCTSSLSDFVFSQNPLVGATVSGVTQVIVTVTDQQGNSATCATQLKPNDTIAPTIVCPADKVINNGAICDFTVLNYIPETVVTENCPNYTVTQNPAQGTAIFSGQTQVTMTVTDQVNQTNTCTFKITVIENQSPVITNCPSSIATCDSIVVFSDVSATDNCLFKIVKTDISGLNSGDVFPVGITAMQYTAIDSSGNTAVCNFNIERYAFPQIPQFVSDSISLCLTTTANIEAIPVTSGTAAWTVGLGTGTISNPNSAATSVSNLSIGLNTFIWTVNSPNCGSKKDSVRVYVNPSPSIATIVRDTVYACASVQSLLSGNIPTVGTSLWTTTGGANILNPTINNTFANQLDPGWNKFYYTISSGACPSTVDSINIYKNLPAKILSSDTSLCKGATNLMVVGNAPSLKQTAIWYFVVGQGNIANSDNDTAYISKISVGANQLVYRLAHPVCGYSYDTLTVAISNCSGEEFTFPTVITPNFDGKNDEFIIDNLHAFYPDCQVTIVNRWGSIVFESTGYSEPWDGTFKGENLPMGTYFYNILLNDADNNKYSGPISIIR